MNTPKYLYQGSYNIKLTVGPVAGSPGFESKLWLEAHDHGRVT